MSAGTCSTDGTVFITPIYITDAVSVVRGGGAGWGHFKIKDIASENLPNAINLYFHVFLSIYICISFSLSFL